MNASRIKELQEQCGVCRRNLRRAGLLFGGIGLLLIGLQFFLSVRLWVPFIIWVILLLSSLGDLVRLLRCHRELRKLVSDGV